MPKDREEIPAHKTTHTYHQRILIRYIEVIFIGPEVNFYARILLFMFMSYSLSYLPPFYTFSFSSMVIVHTTKYKIHLK